LKAASKKNFVAAFLIYRYVFAKKKTRITTGTGIREGKNFSLAFPLILYIV